MLYCLKPGSQIHIGMKKRQTKTKASKQTTLACIDSCGPGRMCLCTSQLWKAVLSLKVEAIQYAIIWIIDDWFLSNQCPHKTMHSLSPWWRERAWPVFVPMPLEAKGKSFNALKPLEVLPLKDSPWNQLGWCVSPYEGAYQSGLPVKTLQREREEERDKVGEEDRVIEWVCVGTGRRVHAFRFVSARLCACVWSKMYTKYKVCLGAMHKSICTHVQECFHKCPCVSVCVLECAAPSSKQERSIVNSITTLSPCTERWPDQQRFNCGPIWSCPQHFSQ